MGTVRPHRSLLTGWLDENVDEPKLISFGRFCVTYQNKDTASLSRTTIRVSPIPRRPTSIYSNIS
jgi:hypothetical protein